MTDRFAATGCEEPVCGCAPEFFRDQLETLLHALSKKSARELRALVHALDATILRRAEVLSASSPDAAWWRGQLHASRV
ncbi:MAG: hypothetical protein ACRDP3_05745 [Streptomyces sp.]|uniref:hypothetical protein n=1 Tax=Streptomyces sp. TaxID=1931 RepID=UPI003D6B92EF